MTNIVLENALYAAAVSDGVTKRTPAARASDVLNVKDFGALGDGSTNDATAIQNALIALWTSAHGGTLFFPPGAYKVNSSIDFSAGSGQSRICGAGLGATSIVGTINDGFILFSPNGLNSGIQEISDLTVTNGSTVLGTGAVRWLTGTTGSIFRNVAFNGQIGLDAVWNTFNVSVINCQASPITPATPGTVGLIIQGVNVSGFRTGAAWDVAIITNGSNGCALVGNSIESCCHALVMGLYQGWASACTVSGNILTVGGTISPAITGGSSQTSFIKGDVVGGSGLMGGITWGDPLSWVQIIDDHNTDGTLTGTGAAGTYRLGASFGSLGPMPVMSRRGAVSNAVIVDVLETEGCKNAIYISNLQASRISNCVLTGVVGEAITNGGGGLKGDTAPYHLLISGATACKFEGIVSGLGTSKASIYIDPLGNTNCVNVDNCFANSTPNAVTDSTTTISVNTITVNGMVSGVIGLGMVVTAASGITGTPTIVADTTPDAVTLGSTTFSAGVMTVVGMSSGAFFQFMFLTGSGIPPNTYITSFGSGTGGAGTYNLSNSFALGATTVTGRPAGPGGPGKYSISGASQGTVTARTVTMLGGVAWVQPSTGSSAAGIRFNNCNNPYFGFTFNQLPGQAGCNTNIMLKEGLVYDITDGQKIGSVASTAWGDQIIGGGTQHLQVRYNGTNWLRIG
jgi:hypothetical protein